MTRQETGVRKSLVDEREYEDTVKRVLMEALGGFSSRALMFHLEGRLDGEASLRRELRPIFGEGSDVLIREVNRRVIEGRRG